MLFVFNQIKSILKRIPKVVLLDHFIMPSRKSKNIQIFAVLMLLLIIPFQNCSQQGGFTSLKEYSSSSDVTLEGSAGDTPPVMDVPPTGLDEKRKICQALIGQPSLKTVSNTTANVAIGLGTNTGGDVSSPNISIVAGSGIIDKASFDANLCSSLFNMRLACEIVTGDGSRPLSFSQAFDINGNDVSKTLSAADISKNIIVMNQCAQNFNYTGIDSSANGSANSKITSNANNANGYRCVSGSFWVRYYITNAIDGATLTAAQMAQRKSNESYMQVTANDGCWNQQKLSNSGMIPVNSQYGGAVAIDGSLAAVVAMTEPESTSSKVGAVYVYEKDGAGKWNLLQRIVLPGASDQDTINSVAIKGTKLFIGSPYGLITGRVAQYERNGATFSFVKDILPGGNQFQNFGFSLSFDGTRLFVGSPYYSQGSLARSGAVYIYDVSAGGVTLKQMIESNSPVAYQAFGWSVSASGNNLAVGAPQAVLKESLGIGEAFLFSLVSNNFSFSKKWEAPAINVGSRLGYSISLMNSKLIIGAPGYDKGNAVNSPNSGGVYYINDINSASTTLGNPKYTGNKDEYVGASVALGDSGLFFSNPYGNSRAGYVLYYNYSNVDVLSFRLSILEVAANDSFGWGFAVQGQKLVVGARTKNDPGTNTGSAYIFQMK